MKQYILGIMTGKEKGLFPFLIRCVFFILSIIFRIGYEVRNLLYDSGIVKSKELSCKVISIGNITLGGVGKTPLVQFVADTLQSKECEVGVLIRGYMPSKDSSIDSDEAVMLSENLPGVDVVVGKDRVSNAERFLKNRKLDVFILDDGFQHRRIFRNLEVVVIDSTNAFGNGHLIPLGVLREPISALKRADIFVLTKTDLNPKKTIEVIKILEKRYPDKKIYLSVHDPCGLYCLQKEEGYDIDILSGEKVCLLSSIGEPKTFEQTVEKLDCKIDKHYAFMDHHVYHENELREIISYCKHNDISKIITTQKDVVKIRKFESILNEEILWFQLNIKLEIIKEKNEFVNRITRIL